MTEQPMVFDAPAPDQELVAPAYGTFTEPPDPDDPAHFAAGTYFEYRGERFRVAPDVGLMALMDFAEIAAEGEDADAMAGLIAMKGVLRDIIHERDWPRFHAWSRKAKINADGFGQIIANAMAVADTAARPTGSPSDFAGGQENIGPNSSGTSGGAESQEDAWTRRKREMGIVRIDADL
jgi:hypothetical protein